MDAATTANRTRSRGADPLNAAQREIYCSRLNVRQLGAIVTSLDRITIDPEQCGGRPCIRGMRIRVIDILDLFAAGLSAEQILEEMPDLDAQDLQAALQYAARRLDHPVLAA